jgi:hypothetical protein
MRGMLLRSGLTGFDYSPVCKVRIVRFEWHLWDRAAAEPAEYPEEGEPEGYILNRSHCADTAAALGDLWELRIAKGVSEVRRQGSILVRESSWTGSDFFRGTETLYNYVSAKARSWLEHQFPSFVRFSRVKATA